MTALRAVASCAGVIVSSWKLTIASDVSATASLSSCGTNDRATPSNSEKPSQIAMSVRKSRVDMAYLE